MLSIKARKVLPRPRSKLGKQLLVGLIVLSVAVGAVAGVVIRQVERSYLTSLITAESERKFELLLLSSMEDVISEDSPRIETTMNALIERDPSLLSSRIVNEEGLVLFSWQPPAQVSQDRVLSFVQDIVFMGENFGTISVDWNVSGMDEEVNRHAYLMALSAGGVVMVLSFCVYQLLNALTIAPINQISQRVLDFKKGKFHRLVSLPTFASSELRRLDESVNALGDFITFKERREAELQEAKDAAESANRLKSEFLANMSHELRTPLNAINGFSEMMGTQIFGPLGDSHYLEYVELINASGKHLLEIINDILDISKLESGEMEIEIEQLDLADAIETSVNMIQASADKNGVRVCKEVAQDLPPLGADRRKVQQILLNVLSNAVKFTPKGGTVTISATWHTSVGMIVKVADTGIGIPADKMDDITEPFVQIESSYSRRYGGTGLGLPITKALIKLHGGALQIHSQLGVGTEVSFNLPTDSIVKPLRKVVAQQDPAFAIQSKGRTAEDQPTNEYDDSHPKLSITVH